MKKVLSPKIEMFNPFVKPFTKKVDNDESIELVIVSPEVVKYMMSENTKIVAKCTPCQCCACR